ncbi:heavy-metal-associated domain-containing protein [Cercophora scortea]|uniref:Heavy-metal-associated domain-containing protein n=1 Tax=Cercophora scortea TaxID=314031 RepID=A0AAE0I9Q3_9PEZI|nr:heavy-metal-associated domain-containing protein [Cercophora scortea]
MSDVVAATPAPVDAEQQLQEHTYKFNVAMSCGGCSGAVDRVLKKLEGVKSYEVSLENQTATVVAEPSLAYEKVLKTIAKTGKKVNTGEADGVSQSVEITA